MMMLRMENKCVNFLKVKSHEILTKIFFMMINVLEAAGCKLLHIVTIFVVSAGANLNLGQVKFPQFPVNTHIESVLRVPTDKKIVGKTSSVCFTASEIEHRINIRSWICQKHFSRQKAG